VLQVLRYAFGAAAKHLAPAALVCRRWRDAAAGAALEASLVSVFDRG